MTYDGSNRKQIREMEKEAKLAEANRLAYTRRIMSDAAGRKWIHDLLSRCHIWHTSFVAGATDVTSFRLGEQNLGLQIFSDVVAAAPAEYTQMMSEASIKDQVHDRRYSDDRSTSSEYPGSTDSGRNADQSIGEYDPFAERDPDSQLN